MADKRQRKEKKHHQEEPLTTEEGSRPREVDKEQQTSLSIPKPGSLESWKQQEVGEKGSKANRSGRSKPYRMEEEVGEKSPPMNQEVKPEGGGGGWGGWGISSFSMFSDLHKAAEEISKNVHDLLLIVLVWDQAVEVVKNAAKGITELEIPDSDSESADEVAKKGPEGGEVEEKEEEESEEDRLRKSALDKLEKASEDSLFGQGLKVLDSSVETFASGAWSALGGAWKGGSTLVSRYAMSFLLYLAILQYHLLH
ncbi:hypothetical protein GW17_00059776 [Ensete ventricosum]|nr:hypothetical protein GW17_00059776 [Ensete ventricosum]RZS26274.1 hypothetical protein BHM03_00059598 [Ensete ventricosum]